MNQICIKRKSDGEVFVVLETHADGSVTIEDGGDLITLGPDEFDVVACPDDPAPGF